MCAAGRLAGRQPGAAGGPWSWFEAWIGAPAGDDPWETLGSRCGRLRFGALAEQGRLLGVPVAIAGNKD